MSTKQALRSAFPRLWTSLAHSRDRLLDFLLPPKHLPPRSLRFVGSGDFRRTGDEFFEHFKRAGLKPHHDVLDVGCGVGRMTLPLIGFLERRYEGFDVVKKPIDWLQENVEEPNFGFTHADIYNSAYNPDGSIQAENFSFPYEDESFDFVFMTSVVTHLLPDAARRYVMESARVLRTGGILFSTWFLVNDVSRGIRFEPAGEYYTDDPQKPENAVAFEEEHVIDLLGAAGLSIEAIHYGAWSGRRQFTSFQDIVVAAKQ